MLPRLAVWDLADARALDVSCCAIAQDYMCELMREIWLRGTYENMLSNLSEGTHKEDTRNRNGREGPRGHPVYTSKMDLCVGESSISYVDCLFEENIASSSGW